MNVVLERSPLQIMETPISTIKRGDIFYGDLSPVTGSEQGGVRPVLVLQNDIGNRHAPTVIVAAISSVKKILPTHVFLDAKKYNLDKDSYVLLEQVKTICKSRLDTTTKVCSLDHEKMKEVNQALAISVGLNLWNK